MRAIFSCSILSFLNCSARSSSFRCLLFLNNDRTANTAPPAATASRNVCDLLSRRDGDPDMYDSYDNEDPECLRLAEPGVIGGWASGCVGLIKPGLPSAPGVTGRIGGGLP